MNDCPKLTKPQRKALAALYVLDRRGEPTWRIKRRNTKRGDKQYMGYRRWDIARVASGGACRSYPLKTMLALRRHGLALPTHEQALELMEMNICTCGCDLWRITDSGRKLAETWNIKIPPKPKGPGGNYGGSGGQDFWKSGDKPPDYDPDSPSQRKMPGDSH